MIENGSGSQDRNLASVAMNRRPRRVPGTFSVGRNDVDPEERTLARATQDAAFHQGTLRCMTHASGPPPVIARAPPSPCLNLRTVPSIAVTRSPSSNAPSRDPTPLPTSSVAVPPPEQQVGNARAVSLAPGGRGRRPSPSFSPDYDRRGWSFVLPAPHERLPDRVLPACLFFIVQAGPSRE
jgi:hypothetical protein